MRIWLRVLARFWGIWEGNSRGLSSAMRQDRSWNETNWECWVTWNSLSVSCYALVLLFKLNLCQVPVLVEICKSKRILKSLRDRRFDPSSFFLPKTHNPPLKKSPTVGLLCPQIVSTTEPLFFVLSQNETCDTDNRRMLILRHNIWVGSEKKFTSQVRQSFPRSRCCWALSSTHGESRNIVCQFDSLVKAEAEGRKEREAFCSRRCVRRLLKSKVEWTSWADFCCFLGGCAPHASCFLLD